MAAQKTAYHIGDGPKQMYDVDAENAVRGFPNEWSWDPWPVEETNAYRREQHEKAVEAARLENRPAPAAPPDLELTDAARADLSADEKARADAYALVQEADEAARERREYDERVVQARALLATPRPQPAAQPAVTLRHGQPQPADTAAAEIPNDWRDGNAAKRRALAMKLGADPNIKTEAADEMIEAEAKRRADMNPNS